MNVDENALLEHMVEVIVREVDPDAIILFGSRTRGDAKPDSDVDLLVIDKENFSPRRSRCLTAGRLYRKLAGCGLAKDLALYSRDEVDRLARSPHHLVARALKEGRRLYERGA
ncbi:nucleotidyltransferase domain-containing protein [uncultured Thiodictyon sp.]|uniref:nucleotidyltransferase domain-containing protein n=1 Tax=uncultured Thiodictyon sp. TaxID=1846217 RepID=UPI0025FBAF51|nr:nucleotidyltransferase domain-containing protein [uncultured Thiodictyon sp.]